VQGWFTPYLAPNMERAFLFPDEHPGNFATVPSVRLVFCTHCRQVGIWHDGKMVVPASGGAPLPNPDLPTDVRADYEEANAILTASPRGAAALLRLAVQKLCKVLGESGENINADIAALVKKGLPVMVQQALDVVRVVGNNAVHPGQIDLQDNPAIAASLFTLVNLIADDRISRPAQVKAMYDSLPDEQKQAIARRDNP